MKITYSHVQECSRCAQNLVSRLQDATINKSNWVHMAVIGYTNVAFADLIRALMVYSTLNPEPRIITLSIENARHSISNGLHSVLNYNYNPADGPSPLATKLDTIIDDEFRDFRAKFFAV